MKEEKIYHKETTDSTQNDARTLVQQGIGRHGDVCSASYQSAGRGRIAGRAWEGEKSQSLMVTLILAKDKIPQSPPLSLILGLAVAQTLEKHFGLSPKIKWPNDIYLNDKKCCGILCEYEKTYYLCGVGLNLNQQRFHPPLDQKATSLWQVTGQRTSPDRVLLLLREEIKRLFNVDSSNLLGQIGHRLLWKGEEKGLLLGDPEKGVEVRGVIRGLNDDGALLVEMNGEMSKIYSAEFL